MGAEEELLITLSGGAPWGFRLQGGTEQQRPLQVSKIRKRSKACRGGLWENDVLVSINGKSCAGLSHATAMQIIDSSDGVLHICVKRYPQRSPGPAAGQLHPTHSPSSGSCLLGMRRGLVDPGGRGLPPWHWGRSARALGYHIAESGAAVCKKRRAVSLGCHSCTDRGSETRPRQGVRRCRAGHNCGHLSTPSSLCSLPPHPPQFHYQHLIFQHLSVSSTGVLNAAAKTALLGLLCHPPWAQPLCSAGLFVSLAELHRHESIQEKNVKEAKTKCRTIASLLTDAPNPHSKGVLMFKKRRQRAKKYTLVSFGSVDEERSYEEEDGVFPTSESEFDEEGFSDARSLTNHSDWDSIYLDIEKPKSDSEQKEEKQAGLSEASGKGARLFEQQRERAGKYTVEKAPVQKSPQLAPAAQPPPDTRKGDMPVPQKPDSVTLSIPPEGVQVPSKQPATLPAQVPAPVSPTFFLPPSSTPDPFSTSTSMFNRSARPFTPGLSGQRPATSSVIFRPSAPKKPSESLGGPSTVVPPFSPPAPGTPGNVPAPTQRSPVSSSTSLYIPAPGRPTSPLESQPRVGGGAPETKPAANTARTSTTSIFLSAPSKPGAEAASTASQPRVPGTASSSLYISPAPAQHTVSSSPLANQPSPAISPAMPRPPSEPLTSREQRIAVPAPRTGILQEARRRGNKKPMFSKIEEKKKNSPNPELLSLVQNLDEKPKGDHPGAGFESGPEEDFLSLGAEACNFMQVPGRKFKTPPPVAPKPQQQGAELVNGAQDMPQLKGKGAELFAKRQSRMDKFVVETTPKPESKPRTPSPSPSLPSSWKYSPNIRAPPPIAYNPMHSPFYPLAASKSQASKAESKVKKAPGQKSGIKVIDLMRHQPYQLKSAMFCFGDPPSAQESPGQLATQASSSFTAAKQVPVKIAKTQEIRRFSTPTPMPASSTLAPTVLAPRSATTLDEPVWRTEMASSAPTTPAPFQVELQSPKPYQSSPEPGQVGQGPSPNPPPASRFLVARPKFSAVRTGMQANVWRPSFGHH
ncbi:SYP2L protein, partial [Centropus bengalensis]|nr:SYP2L protein [Centropus bengalensis]